MNIPLSVVLRCCLLLGLAASCAGAPPPPLRVEEPPEPKQAPILAEPPAFRITLTGDPLTATGFVEEDMGVIPFGGWINSVPMSKAQYGYEFSISLTDCSAYGCAMQMPENYRVLIARKGIAGAVRLSLYDEGWRPSGTPTVNDSGWVAIPMSSPKNEHEVWIIKENGHMHKRLPYSIPSQVIARWGSDCVYLIHGSRSEFKATRITISTGHTVSTTVMEAWWYTCEGNETAQAVGLPGEISDMLGGLTAIPVYRRGEAKPGLLDLGPPVHPMTPEGLASPTRVSIDCRGRINVVSALGSVIWCMRFGPDGALLNAAPLSGALTGDYHSILTDKDGRFYFLVTEMDKDGLTPLQLHLRRLL